jgi:mannose-6-phosphate isomerase-like protein (cupin superfamily)
VRVDQRSAVQTARYVDKAWDWDAFPANSGYPELERAQMRYIGTGGSPKPDARTIPPGAFTCSLIYQQPRKRAAVHYHAVEELFFVHSGTLTLTWQYGNKTIDFDLGPGDAVLNPSDRPHGFRNDTDTDVVLQIMVSTAARMLPTYTEHPSMTEAPVMGPASEATRPALMRDAAQYIARAERAPVTVDIAGGAFITQPLVFEAEAGGQVPPQSFCFATSTLERGGVTPDYTVAYEEAFMVMDGVLDVELLGGAAQWTTHRFGPRDLAHIPPGIPHRLRNSGAEPVRFATIAGSAQAVPVAWALAGAAL